MTSRQGVQAGLRFGAIGEAWRLYRRQWGVWSLTSLVALVCALLGTGLAAGALGIASHSPLRILVGFAGPGTPLLSVILTFGIAGFFVGGMMRMAVNQTRGRQPQVEDLFSATDVWFDLVLGSALLGIFLAIGYGFFVLPGLIVGGLFMFMYPLIVDSRLPATGAMIQSFHATKEHWLLATVVHLAIGGAALSGILLFGLGLFLTMPLYALSTAVLYRELFPGASAPSWENSPAWGKKPGVPFEEHDYV